MEVYHGPEESKMNIEQLGPYRIGRQLGRGGMGTVFEAVDLDTDEPAAVKLLAPALAAEEGFRERFQAEIETLRKLNHPNIVRIFGFGRQEDHLFYSMELVEGDSLENEIRGGQRFAWQEVVEIGIQMCQALRHAHDRGIIHRDIKPANLLLTEDGRVKLSDFGIARLFGSSGNTTAGTMVGTVEYMAPEQATGGPVGPASDLCSLGAVFYALLSGRPPFTGKSVPEVVKKQQFDEAKPIGQIVSDVPDELEQIIAELLRKDPSKRIAGAGVLQRRLEAIGAAVADETGASQPAIQGELPATQIADRVAGASDGKISEPSEKDIPETKETSSFAIDGDDSSEGGGPKKDADVAMAETGELLDDSVFDDSSTPESERPAREASFTPIGEHELDLAKPLEDHVRVITPQTILLIVTLAAMGIAGWYFLQPPSADRLYDKISSSAKTGSIDGLLRVSDSIDEFLSRFPADSRCDTLREYEAEIELHRLERIFERRARGLAGTENLLPIERDYLEALNYLRLDRERGMAKLRALVDVYDRGHELPGPTGRCLELARRRLGQLDEKTGPQIEQLRENVEDMVNRADELLDTDSMRARNMYNGVIELYGDKPWAADAVRHAREALDGQ